MKVNSYAMNGKEKESGHEYRTPPAVSRQTSLGPRLSSTAGECLDCTPRIEGQSPSGTPECAKTALGSEHLRGGANSANRLEYLRSRSQEPSWLKEQEEEGNRVICSRTSLIQDMPIKSHAYLGRPDIVRAVASVHLKSGGESVSRLKNLHNRFRELGWLHPSLYLDPVDGKSTEVLVTWLFGDFGEPWGDAIKAAQEEMSGQIFELERRIALEKKVGSVFRIIWDGDNELRPVILSHVRIECKLILREALSLHLAGPTIGEDKNIGLGRRGKDFEIDHTGRGELTRLSEWVVAGDPSRCFGLLDSPSVVRDLSSGRSARLASRGGRERFCFRIRIAIREGEDIRLSQFLKYIAPHFTGNVSVGFLGCKPEALEGKGKVVGPDDIWFPGLPVVSVKCTQWVWLRVFYSFITPGSIPQLVPI